MELIRHSFPEVSVYRTDKPGAATRFAREIKQNSAIVIAAGGDGTINEVLNGLIGGNCILGVIPIGSGNDFVRMLNMPRDYEKAIGIIQQQNIMRIDVGKVNERYFLNGLGIGFDAYVVIESQKVKWLRGFVMYLFAILKTLTHYHNMRIHLEINGRQEERDIFMLTIGNGKSLGGGFFLTPRAKLDDGMFDICIFRALSRLEVLKNLPKALNGKHLSLHQVEYLQAQQISVSSPDWLPMHIDGELLPTNIQHVSVEVIPRAIKVIHNLNTTGKEVI